MRRAAVLISLAVALQPARQPQRSKTTRRHVSTQEPPPAEEVIVQVGSGKITPEAVATQLFDTEEGGKEAKPASMPSQNPIARFFRRVSGGPEGIVVDGLDGIKHSIANGHGQRVPAKC